jgi:hypothetical protein
MLLLLKIMLVIAGVIHLLPLPGVFGASQLTRLYGVPFDDPNLVILMRHRAVLFGLLGLFLIYAAWQTDLVTIALAAGLISALSFILLAWSVGGYNPAISRIVIADWIAVACLVVAAGCHWLAGKA